jgi:hypothetical protein
MLDRLAVTIVALAALVIAARALADHVADPDGLFRAGAHHDRHAHFGVGLNLALALRTLDPIWFLSEVERQKSWPPFHGLVLGAVLAAGGPHHRLAIVPSLAGWVITVVCAFLVARSALRGRVPGTLAGGVAATLTAVSPALRVLGADVMLESLGAGLSALAVVAYRRAAAATTDPRPWRLLALLLTFLFFHKGNYWGIVVGALVGAVVVDDRATAAEGARRLWRAIAGAAPPSRVARDGLILAAVVVLVAAGAIWWRGPTTLGLGGQAISLYPPRALLTLAYALLFLRGALLWARHRAAIRAALGMRGRIVFAWHAMPVLISFLFPQRLPRFLAFVAPTNTPPELDRFDLVGGVTFYARVLVAEFHPAPWLALAALALAAVAASRAPWLPRGTSIVFTLAVLGFLAVVIHPNHQGRHLTSWLFAVWIAAGIGAGVLVERVSSRPFPALQGTVAASALALLLLGAAASDPAAAVRLRPSAGPTDLDMVRPYLPHLDGMRAAGIATTFGPSSLFTWTIRERCQCRFEVQSPWLPPFSSRDETRRAMAALVATSTATRFVIIDAPGDEQAEPAAGIVHANTVGIIDAMQSQSRFVLMATHPVPGKGASVTVWRRRDPP